MECLNIVNRRCDEKKQLFYQEISQYFGYSLTYFCYYFKCIALAISKINSMKICLLRCFNNYKHIHHIAYIHDFSNLKLFI